MGILVWVVEERRSEGEGEPFWKRVPLPPRAPPSPPKTFTQVGMARPRRWAQGLSSPQAGKGAGECRRRKSRSQCGGNRVRMRSEGPQKEKRTTGRRWFLSANSSYTKVAVGKQTAGGAGLVRYIDGAAKDGERCAGRIFFQQENPVGRYAERAGKARYTGRHRPDEKVWKRGKPTEGGRRPCPLRRGSCGQRQEGGNATGAAYCFLSMMLG